MQKDTATYILSCLLEKARKESFSCVCLSNDFNDPHGRWQYLVGYGIAATTHDLSDVDLMSDTPWFGYLSYDYKNFVEPMLQSQHEALSKFSLVKFVQPQTWVGLDRNGQLHGNADGLILWEGLMREQPSGHESPDVGVTPLPQLQWEAHTHKEDYLQHIAQIQNHIKEGDFYEMNHCIAFSAQAEIDPYQTFAALNRRAPAPFACFVKDIDQYLLCASPERYMCLRDKVLISQPIKGTRKRQEISQSAQTQMDAQAVLSLKNSEKDRAENIMIVDLVRNDLSRLCVPGSVHVPELCEVYTYSHVHQMISTVVGQPKAGVGLKEIVHATFPMGSMTGAPKIAVMQHTEQLENFSRGLYSGSVGYVYQGEMDMNVVIRSLVYDATKQRLSYAVGGAITIDSDAVEEYQECQDKAATVLSIFG